MIAMSSVGRGVAVLVVVVVSVVGWAGNALALSESSSTACGFDCHVTTDAAHETFRGGLLVPDRGIEGNEGWARSAVNCVECRWLVELWCLVGGDQTHSSDCLTAADGCTRPALRYQASLSHDPTDPFVVVGTFCREPGEPLTPEGLMPGVRAHFLQSLPPLRPSFQPARRGIVNLPVLFATGQPPSLDPPTFGLDTHRVVLRATTSWLWDFGDGEYRDFDLPGGPWPDVDVSHTYAFAGTFDVRVTATWQGQFWVDGAGPFTVTGPALTQAAPLIVPVVEAHAVLIG